MPSSARYPYRTRLPPFPTRRSSDLDDATAGREDDGRDEPEQHALRVVRKRRARRDLEEPEIERVLRLVPVGPCPELPPEEEHEQHRSEEHTSELQSLTNIVCRLLLDTPTARGSPLSLHDALPISTTRPPAARMMGAMSPSSTLFASFGNGGRDVILKSPKSSVFFASCQSAHAQNCRPKKNTNNTDRKSTRLNSSH